MPEDIEKKRARWRRWYQNHTDQAREFYRQKARRRRKEIHAWYQKHKAQLQCARCSEDHLACLDFHHKNPEEKISIPSQMVRQSYSIARIKAEMKKCIVLCSNCHRKEHYSEE